MSIALGLGDILLSRLLTEHNHLTEQIYINKWIIRRYRDNSTTYFNFILYIAGKVFPEQEIQVIDVPINGIVKNIHEYKTCIQSKRLDLILGFCRFLPFPTHLSLRKYFDVTPFLEEEYIVFLTKVRLESSVHKFHREKEIFLSSLRNLKKECTIVILGERTFKTDLEIRCGKIFSIYNTLMEMGKQNKVLDLTLQDMNHGTSHEIFERDVRILANAKHVFGIGFGGNFVMASLFSVKYTFYTGNLIHPYLKHIVSLRDKDKTLCSQMEDFVTHLIHE